MEHTRLINKYLISATRKNRITAASNYIWLEVEIDPDRRKVLANNRLVIERLYSTDEIYPKETYFGESTMLGMARKSIGKSSFKETKSFVYKLCSSDEFKVYSLSQDDKFKIHNLFINHEGFKISNEWPLILLGPTDFIKNNECDEEFIDDSLGLYFPVLNIIILNDEKIAAETNKMITSTQSYIPYDVFFRIILYHELGHWISHEIAIKTINYWDDSSFNSSSTDLVEFWAQYLAYLLLPKSHRVLMQIFSNNQPDEYKNFQLAINKSQEFILRFLEFRELDSWTKLKDKIEEVSDSSCFIW